MNEILHSPHSSHFFRPAPTKKAQRTDKPRLAKPELSNVTYFPVKLKGFVQGMHEWLYIKLMEM